jgi:hypothetical protein
MFFSDESKNMKLLGIAIYLASSALFAQEDGADPVMRARELRAQISSQDLPPVPRGLTEPPPLPPPALNARDIRHPRKKTPPPRSGAKRPGPAKSGSSVKAVAPAKKGVPAKAGVPAKKAAPAKVTAPTKKATPAQAAAPAISGAPVKASAPAKKRAPIKAGANANLAAQPKKPAATNSQAKGGQPRVAKPSA